MTGDQSRPASWIIPTAVAAGSGIVVLGLGWMSASESGMGVLLLTLPTVLAEIVFLLASLLALVSLWEGRPVRSDPAARILVWALILVWLGIVVLGLPGLVAGATEQASTPVAQRVSIGLCVAVAVAAIASLPSRASGRR